MELVQQQWIILFTCPGWHRLTRSGYRCAAGTINFLCAAGTRRLLAADNHRRLIEFRNRLLVCSIHPERKHFPRLLVAEATRVVAALQPGPPLRRRYRPFGLRVTLSNETPGDSPPIMPFRCRAGLTWSLDREVNSWHHYRGNGPVFASRSNSGAAMSVPPRPRDRWS